MCVTAHTMCTNGSWGRFFRSHASAHASGACTYPPPPIPIPWHLITSTHIWGNRYIGEFDLTETVAQISIMAPRISTDHRRMKLLQQHRHDAVKRPSLHIALRHRGNPTLRLLLRPSGKLCDGIHHLSPWIVKPPHRLFLPSV